MRPITVRSPVPITRPVAVPGGFGGARGRCLEGGLSAPRHGVTQACGAGGVWAFLSCPPEDECENGHHTCAASQVCRDLPDGFTCTCRAGYSADSRTGECRPVCRQGCANGTCLEPDRCRCHFGFVGSDCAVPCACNGHSDCAGPAARDTCLRCMNNTQVSPGLLRWGYLGSSDCAGPAARDTCLRCMNNTQGPQCQRCRPLFVGSALGGGTCLTCNTPEHTCNTPEHSWTQL
ncbi:multiple epidermal growth factor-like domains protein 8 [Motacilla alba alba]|uniref:multiple epidermal growth factor-like domains protein 8 n=1 Tax=Motacilla alba alba TaxID=1094192 RepID=UPI0018D532A1|nr:multiple epidermal growth factor-like domains protein 8 [Motacilla alba alba]